MSESTAIKLEERHEIAPGCFAEAGCVLWVDPREASELIRRKKAVPVPAEEVTTQAPPEAAMRPRPRPRVARGRA